MESPVHPAVTSITVTRAREDNRLLNSMRLIALESIHNNCNSPILPRRRLLWHAYRMKRVLVILLVFGFCILSAGESFALPECPGSPATTALSWTRYKHWTDCIGTHILTKDSKYVGEWKDGKKHGQGTFTFASGNKYVGDWKDGKRHGQGTYTFANGNKYVGEFRNGEFHGQGTYTRADGRVQKGLWVKGKLIP